MDILLDPRNKPTEEIFIFLKIQDGRWWSKVRNRPNLTPQITFRLRIWIQFVRFGQYLTWTYYLTLRTILRIFLFFSKTKMAAGGQKLNFGSKSHFGLANGSLSSDLDKIWQADTTQP